MQKHQVDRQRRAAHNELRKQRCYDAMLSYESAREWAEQAGYQLIQYNMGQYTLVAPAKYKQVRLEIHPGKQSFTSDERAKWAYIDYDMRDFRLLPFVQAAIRAMNARKP